MGVPSLQLNAQESVRQTVAEDNAMRTRSYSHTVPFSSSCNWWLSHCLTRIDRSTTAVKAARNKDAVRVWYYVGLCQWQH